MEMFGRSAQALNAEKKKRKKQRRRMCAFGWLYHRLVPVIHNNNHLNRSAG
jgi:hypothetical protein